MSVKKLYLVGAGDLGREILNIVRMLQDRDAFEWEPRAFVDDNPADRTKLEGLDVLPLEDELSKREPSETGVVIAVGTPRFRQRLFRDLKQKGFIFPSVVHPDALVERSASIEEGCVLFSGAVCAVGVHLDVNVVVNYNAVLGHDAVIGAHSVISPGALLGGRVSVGEASLIGLGSQIVQGVTIGEGCSVGMGSSILTDLAAGTATLPPRPGVWTGRDKQDRR